MKVKDLIAQLKELPEDATVVANGHDHSFRRLDIAFSVDADFYKGACYEYASDFGYDPQGVVVPVVVIE